MTLLVPNNGESDLLSFGLNKSAPENGVLRLYQNDITPSETDTAASYTEATFTGYAAVTLTGASWTIVEGAPSEASYAQQAFVSSADQTLQAIYGYFVTRITSGRIAWAERFSAAPYNIENNNDTINVTSKITLD